MRDLVICGAGGFADEVTCLVNRINAITPQWNFLGYIDKDMSTKGEKRRYGTILGDISFVNNSNKPLSVVIAIGNPATVKKVIGEIHNHLVDYPNLIAPDVVFMDQENVTLGQGNIFSTGCLVSCNTHIGDFNTFNDFVSLGHDTIIGNYNSFMTATRISGLVTIGNSNFFGVNSCTVQGVKIGNNTTIAAGSAIMRRTKDGYTYIGVPASALVIKK